MIRPSTCRRRAATGESGGQMGQILTREALRAIIPEPSPTAFAKIRDRLCDQGMAFIRRCPFLALATVGSWGIEVSSKGDHPGFVEIVDDRTLLIPERKGNQFALGLGNILADPRVGLMLLRPATDELLRISGRAILIDDADVCERLAAGGKPAVLAIRVEIDRAAFHCVRSARRAGLWRPETWDAPTSISFGQIYAEALQKPDIKELFEDLTEKSNASLY
jgi:PPOX class probable FMN-dependent enzyme